MDILLYRMGTIGGNFINNYRNDNLTNLILKRSEFSQTGLFNETSFNCIALNLKIAILSNHIQYGGDI